MNEDSQSQVLSVVPRPRFERGKGRSEAATEADKRYKVESTRGKEKRTQRERERENGTNESKPCLSGLGEEALDPGNKGGEKVRKKKREGHGARGPKEA